MSSKQPRSIWKVRIVPRSKMNAIKGILPDGTIRISIKAPPVDGKANRELVNYLAGLLEIPRASIGILKGSKSRNKRISISGLDRESISEKLLISLG